MIKVTVAEVNLLGYEGDDKEDWEKVEGCEISLSEELSRRLTKTDQDGDSYVHIAADYESQFVSEVLKALPLSEVNPQLFFVEDACECSAYISLDRSIGDLALLIEWEE